MATKPGAGTSAAREDGLLDAAVAQSKICAHHGCKKSVVTMGSVCKLCKLRFCFEHMQAEVHGCGIAASQKARRESKLPQGVKTSAYQHDGAKVALQKKVAAMSSSRQRRQTPAASSGKGKGKK
eukprot:jgi/Tetstr1/447512/TSEL_034892.t1